MPKKLSVTIISMALNVKTHIPKIVLAVRFIILFSLFIKNNEIQNTNAIFDMLEPTAFPIANIVSFFSADSIEINISGAEVDIPIRKKLAQNLK